MIFNVKTVSRSMFLEKEESDWKEGNTGVIPPLPLNDYFDYSYEYDPEDAVIPDPNEEKAILFVDMDGTLCEFQNITLESILSMTIVSEEEKSLLLSDRAEDKKLANEILEKYYNEYKNQIIAEIRDEIYNEKNQYSHYRNLKPYKNMVEAIKLLKLHSDIQVCILSASPGPEATRAKQEWLDEVFKDENGDNFITKRDRIFTEDGKVKASFVNNSEKCFFLEDYLKNLDDACPPGHGIKCENDVSNAYVKGPNYIPWDGPTVNINSTPMDIAKGIVDTIGKELQVEVNFDVKEQIQQDFDKDR